MTKYELIEELEKLSDKINNDYDYEVNKYADYEVNKYADLIDDIVSNIKYGDPKIIVKSDKEY